MARMNRRDFFLLKPDHEVQTVELSCETLYMRYIDSCLDGTTPQLFESVERTLSEVNAVQLKDASWLMLDELKPVQTLLAAFRARGGTVE
jgi:hypothetical protein